MSNNPENVTDRQRFICTAIKKNGQPCTLRAVTDGLCIAHRPQATEARRRGGLNSSKQARLNAMLPARLKPILSLLEKAIEETYKGELDTRIAQAMASLSRGMVTVMEAGVFEERIQRLEHKMDGMKGHRQ